MSIAVFFTDVGGCRRMVSGDLRRRWLQKKSLPKLRLKPSPRPPPFKSPPPTQIHNSPSQCR